MILLNASIEVIIVDNFKIKIIVITNYDSIILADEIGSSINMILQLKIDLMIWKNVFMLDVGMVWIGLGFGTKNPTH